MNNNKKIVDIIIAESLLCDINSLSPEKHLVKDLLADSISFIDMITNLCDHFNIDIPEADLANINLVNDLYVIIDKYTQLKEE